jgi:hypothetical protein
MLDCFTSADQWDKTIEGYDCVRARRAPQLPGGYGINYEACRAR